MSERREGWYWVKISDCPWEAAHWTGESWDLSGDDVPRDEDELGDVLLGPRIPTPDEPWQCVPVDPTDEMIDAASESLDGSMCGYEASRAIRAYRATLSSAPNPEDV